MTEADKNANYELILECINSLKNQKINNANKLEIIEMTYTLLIDRYGCNKGTNKDLETQKEVGTVCIMHLLPILDKLVTCSEVELTSRSFELYQKVWALTARTSLEHFIDYMEFDRDEKVLANRRGVLRPFIFYLNKQEFDENLELVCASYPPAYR